MVAPEFYREYIANESVAQIRLVVGRQNPHMAANLDFARRLMAFANKTNGPVVKEIFISHGNYNQDLLSTALLIEAGTYSNRKEEAINGIERLAEAVPVVLGITSPPGVYYHPAGGSGVWVAVVMITALVLLCAGLFIIINAGGLNEAKKLLVDFYRRDLAGILEPLGNNISVNILQPLKNRIPVQFQQRVKIVIDRIKKYLSTTGS
ncbi:MAG: stage II sporulation protein P [Desulfocucumaceae bacterium]